MSRLHRVNFDALKLNQAHVTDQSMDLYIVQILSILILTFYQSSYTLAYDSKATAGSIKIRIKIISTAALAHLDKKATVDRCCREIIQSINNKCLELPNTARYLRQSLRLRLHVRVGYYVD